MAHFPVFLDLKGKTVLIVGNTPEAQRKAAILAPFQPEIRFLSELRAEDLTPVPALVILTGENRREASQLCRDRNIPVNSADDPHHCTFFFPSVICRGDMTIGISSGATAPAASAAVRRQIESALPENLEQILLWLSQLTAFLRREVPDIGLRAKLLAEISAESFQKNRPLTGDELKKYM